MRYSRFWFPLAAGLAWSLGGCTPTIVTRCPALVQYPPEFSVALADEAKGPYATQAITDYVNLRDRCKAINGQ